MSIREALARALARADGKVWWTDAFPVAYRDQADALLSDTFWRQLAQNQEVVDTVAGGILAAQGSSDLEGVAQAALTALADILSTSSTPSDPLSRQTRRRDTGDRTVAMEDILPDEESEAR